MTAQRRVTFGFQAAPTSDRDDPDRVLYEEVLEDCALGQKLGYDSAWMLEHHFSDYYPTPSPLLFMSHVAAACPGLGLGTCVLVLPWYHPLRLAEEIAMLRTLAKGPMHLAIGRGTAKSEYDAYGVAMPEARSRFAESWEIIRKGLSGEEFTHSGRFWQIERPIRLRPEPCGRPIHFYGAIGSIGSAEIMADLGLPPMCLAQFPDHLLMRILKTWRERTAARGGNTDVHFPLSIKVLVADSDEEAYALGRKYYPRNFEIQARHYEVDANPWENIPEYEQFSRMFSNMRAMTDPDKLGPFMQMNLVGSPETVERRVRELMQIGFDYFAVSSATPGSDAPFRREMLTRFAREVAPRIDSRFGKSDADAPAAPAVRAG